MSGGGRRRASGDPEAATDDPDAFWKPAGKTVVAERERPRRGRPARASRRRAGAASPWSRESIEAPLPSIEQIRERWRRELGFDDANAVPARGRAPVVVSAAVDHPSQDAPRSTMSGDVVLGGLVVALVVAAALATAWALMPPRSPRALDAETLPVGATEQWNVDVGDDTALAFGADAVGVAMTGELRVLDSVDGMTRWTAPLDDGEPVAVQIYDDVVVTVEQTSLTVLTLSGFDLRDGSPVWTRSTAFAEISLDRHAPFEVASPDGRARLLVLDPASGIPFGPDADATDAAAPDGYAIAGRDGRWSLIDLGERRWIEPSVSEFGLRSIAPIGERLVAFTDDSDIVLYDRDGSALDRRPFVSAAVGDFAGRAELVGAVPGTTLAIVASGSSIGFDTGDDAIDVVWEIPGRVGAPVETQVGPVAVARVVAPSGAVDHVLVDATDGSTLATTDPGITRESPPFVAADGFLVAPAVGDPSRTIRAFDFDGRERWTLELGPDVDFHIADGVVYTVGRDGVVAAHR